MTTNLPANYARRFTKTACETIGHIQFFTLDPYATGIIVGLRGSPTETAFTRKGDVKHDVALHGRVVARHDDQHAYAWKEWIATQPRTPTKWVKPTPPVAITLKDLRALLDSPVGEATPTYATTGVINHDLCDSSCPDRVLVDGIHRDGTTEVPQQVTPRLADVVKDGNGDWYITTRPDLGTFTSRDKARAAVRACKP